MTRMGVELKRCEYRLCRLWLLRKRRACGLEKPKQYAARRYCDKRCEFAAKADVKTARYCRQCGSRLCRKRRPNGAIEIRAQFTARRYCDMTCCRLWNEEHQFEVSATKRKAADTRWKRERMARRESL